MRKNPRIYDKDLYKHRNLIERMFNNVKQFRRAITRDDKLDLSYHDESRSFLTRAFKTNRELIHIIFRNLLMVKMNACVP
jgi:hypothetical protein